MKSLSFFFVAMVSIFAVSTGHADVSKAERRELLSRAALFRPVDTRSLNLFSGPEASLKRHPGGSLQCRFVEPAAKINGKTEKFFCRDSQGTLYKVKYGIGNAEIYAEVLGSRLLWALGFYSDTVMPVHVKCFGCSADPFRDRQKKALPGYTEFPAAIIDVRHPGKSLESFDDEGWQWKELAIRQQRFGNQARVENDALKLLMAFMQAFDNKASNNRFYCADNSVKELRNCRRPILEVHDLGWTFGGPWDPIMVVDRGRANRRLQAHYGSWKKSKIWKDERNCTAFLPQSPVAVHEEFRGVLRHPQISEAGRRMAATLLAALSERQIYDLFRASRIGLRNETMRDPVTRIVRAVTIHDWVRLFQSKVSEIADRAPCPR